MMSDGKVMGLVATLILTLVVLIFSTGISCGTYDRNKYNDTLEYPDNIEQNQDQPGGNYDRNKYNDTLEYPDNIEQNQPDEDSDSSNCSQWE